MNFCPRESDSMKLSSSPSLEERINFLIQNYDRNDPLEIRSMISMDGMISSGGPRPDSRHPVIDSMMLSSGGSSRLSEMLPGLSRLPFCVKREESSESKLMLKIRTKVCRKAFEILREVYRLPTSEAKMLSLSIEEKFNLLYPGYEEAKHYVNAIKTIFKKLKVE